MAKKHGLPVILHVRKSADRLLKHLREIPVSGGIAHAFNGSAVQAAAFIDRHFCLGFGGTVTFEASRRIRHLASTLPATALVLETDGPDIPPQWIYVEAQRRRAGQPQGLNSSVHLPAIARVVAGLRGQTCAELRTQTTANALRVLPKLVGLRTAVSEA